MIDSPGSDLQTAFSDRLVEALEVLTLALSAQQKQKLLIYLTLMAKWNKVYNLTAIRGQTQMFTHHLLDSLAVVGPLSRHLANLQGVNSGESPIAPFFSATPSFRSFGAPSRALRMLDVGSGAGLPGVVIAICVPWLEVVCVDAVGKKASFIQQVALELGLSNLRGVHARVEGLPLSVAQEGFDVVTSRAFASLGDFWALSCRWLRLQTGVCMAMKAKSSEVHLEILQMEKMARLPQGVTVFHVEQVMVPFLQEERCLVWMGASCPTK